MHLFLCNKQVQNKDECRGKTGEKTCAKKRSVSTHHDTLSPPPVSHPPLSPRPHTHTHTHTHTATTKASGAVCVTQSPGLTPPPTRDTPHFHSSFFLYHHTFSLTLTHSLTLTLSLAAPDYLDRLPLSIPTSLRPQSSPVPKASRGREEATKKNTNEKKRETREKKSTHPYVRCHELSCAHKPPALRGSLVPPFYFFLCKHTTISPNRGSHTHAPCVGRRRSKRHFRACCLFKNNERRNRAAH